MRLSRREFLAAMGGTAALLCAGPLAALGAETPADTPGTPAALLGANGPDWAAVRRQFLLQDGLAFLNCGSLGPSPVVVLEETMAAWRALERDPVSEGYGPQLDRMNAARVRAAALLNCAPDELAITGNTTEGMNAIAQGVDLRAGQRVLTTNHEHEGGHSCWEYYAKHRGVVLETVELPVPPRNAGEVLDLFAAKITRDTRLISVSHVTFVTGLRLPIRELAALAHANDALLVVDGAQAPGGMRVDVRALECDAYATSAHKWLLAPKGTGLLYIRRAAQAQIAPLQLAQGYGAYTGATGMRNVPGGIGLGIAVDFLQGLGMAAVEQHNLALRNRLYAALQHLPRLTLASPPPGDMASPLLSLVLPGHTDNGAVVDTLRKRDRIVVKAVPSNILNAIRVSTHCYNNEDDVDRLVSALKKDFG